ncbi:N-acetylneuraminate synthase family protein [Desulfovibrio subterraneus]|nr:N-acetylneuraminate synthase family protein [Desulfovibrio subterraneus]
MQVSFGSMMVGDGNPVCIVFEAGPTHNGLESALKLVDVAADAGADAVKFQVVDAEKLVSDPAITFSYQWLADKATGRVETATESLLEIIKRRELTFPEWETVIGHCRKRGIEFFSTATTEEEVHFLAAMGVGSVKICSGDLTFHHLLRVAAQYPWTVQIDTGSSTIGEVENAILVLEEANCKNIIINHCPSGYPAHPERINLRVLTTLKQMFSYPVAFSDHTTGDVMDVAAVSLGAHMIEKTITLDRNTRSPEHIMSLEPHEAKDFVKTIRSVELALGSTRRLLGEPEQVSRVRGRRSLFAGCALQKGDILVQSMLTYARPGDGIPAHLDHLVLGRKLVRDVPAGRKLQLSDFE